MKPTVTPFHHQPTGTWTYVLVDEPSRGAVIIDPVLDYDWRSGRTGTKPADQVLQHCKERGLEVSWILETHAHADHISSQGAGDLQEDLRAGRRLHARR
jgi:glyoxylase-like metal-dependent hydrolase (beta-lactamase superfamily II)